MVLKEWLPAQSLQEFDLKHTAFWIQIHGLPLEIITQKSAIKIGKSLGNLLDVDENFIPEESTKQFLRIRMEIDVTQPLIDGVIYPRLKDLPAKISFKYECLSEFYYICGSIGHIQQICPLYFGKACMPQYNSKLRA